MSAEYDDGALSYAFYGLHGYAEVWLDGRNTGRIVRKNGEHTLLTELEEGEHELKLYAVSTNELIGATFTVEHLDPYIARYGILVTNLAMEERSFTLEHDEAILTVRLGDMTETLRVSYPAKALDLMSEDGFTQLTVACDKGEYIYQIGAIASACGKLPETSDDMLILTAVPMNDETINIYAFSELQNALYELSVEPMTKPANR